MHPAAGETIEGQRRHHRRVDLGQHPSAWDQARGRVGEEAIDDRGPTVGGVERVRGLGRHLPRRVGTGPAPGPAAARGRPRRHRHLVRARAPAARARSNNLSVPGKAISASGDTSQALNIADKNP